MTFRMKEKFHESRIDLKTQSEYQGSLSTPKTMQGASQGIHHGRGLDRWNFNGLCPRSSGKAFSGGAQH